MMSDRWREEGHKTAPNDEPDVLREPVIAGGVGGVIAGPLDSLDDRDSLTEEALDDEQDWESPEGDDALISGHSPEFEHLTKRSQ